MGRSTVDAWLEGPGDLKTAVVEDVPVPGQSVLVQALAAGYVNEAQSEATELKQVGRDQIVSVNKATMEVLQFAHGVVEPKFTVDQARAISEKYGPAFRKVIDRIDELSATDKDAITEAEARFPGGGEGQNGSGLDVASAAPDSRPDLPLPVGAEPGQDDPGDDDRQTGDERA